jgi:hypothetical protein
VAKQSPWLESIQPPHRSGARHFVIAGRDGYVEVIASHFRWRWLKRESTWVDEE